ncbi:MAG TPA: RcnB family protein [Rhizomicrobium sp.]|jgi:Ni/Co efflux regulator RcnB|nr:RcnB family protein [Rhizomicrobium sp.]
MKRRLVIFGALASLFLPAIALAQPDRRPNRPGPGPGGPGDRNRPGRGPGYGPRPSQRPPRFSWRGRNYNRYRAPAFHYPRGYSYRRWVIGAALPTLFLSSLYYFDDWNRMGITPPPPGRRWVRYGPDLLLVNVRNGRVEDVIYGAFY